MTNHRATGAEHDIASDLIDALHAASDVAAPQDSEPYQGMDSAYFRVTSLMDGETYYVQVSKRKQV